MASLTDDNAADGKIGGSDNPITGWMEHELSIKTLAHEKKQCYNIPKRILQAANVLGCHTQEIQTETISAGRETYDTP